MGTRCCSPSMKNVTAIPVLCLAVAVFTGCADESPVAVAGSDDGLLATKSSSVATNAASSDMVRGQLYLNIDVPAICFDGAFVHFEGPVEYRINVTIDGRGVQHGQAFYHWDDVVATMGSHTWRTTAGLEAYMLMNYEFTNPFLPVPRTDKLGDPAVFHHTGALRFKSEDDAPDLYVSHVVQLVTDPNANLRVDRHVLELLDCR